MNKQQDTSKILIKYIKDEKKQLRGVVASIGFDVVGWSQCNVKAGDKFSKERGKNIAISRCFTGTSASPAKINGDDVVSHEVEQMKERSRKYYQ